MSGLRYFVANGLMLLPIQFLAGKVAMLDGNDLYGFVWWSYVLMSGIAFSIGHNWVIIALCCEDAFHNMNRKEM